MSMALVTSVSLSKTADSLRGGELDIGAYVERICDRIEAVDPEIRALVPGSETHADRRARLRDVAEAVRSRTDPADRPPLYGCAVGVKDIIQVEGFTTRAGSALPPELIQGPEATCVSRLRDAGALLVGKTETTEFAGPSAPGLTRSPHHLEHTPGGSSSGSAAGVAAGLFPLAVGTQTGGSVIRPAAFCGIIGMTTSYDRIPRDGIVPRAKSVDQVGMFTQDLDGMAIAAGVLCDDWDEADTAVGGLPSIGVPQDAYFEAVSDEMRDRFDASMARLDDAGYRVERVDIPTFDAFGDLQTRHRWVTRGETAMVHHDWYEQYDTFYRAGSVDDLEKGRATTVEQLARGRAGRAELRAELADLMADRDLDLWAAPAAPGPAPSSIRTIGSGVMNLAWTHAGLPAITLPAGTIDGLPIGIQLVGSYDEDEQLLARATLVADSL